MNTNNSTSTLGCGVRIACEELGFKQPYPKLMQLPINEDGSKAPIKSASVILFYREETAIRILMVHEKWKQDALALPGGGRALNKTQWDNFTEKQIKHEKSFPLLTASRELCEEMPWLYKTTELAYSLLNSPKTTALKNSGWKTYPVVTYLRELPKELVSIAKKATESNSDIKTATKEISGVSIVQLKDLESTWNQLGWTAKKLAERQHRINNASLEHKADLSDLPFEKDLTIPVGSKEFRQMKSYVARSIFSNIRRIKDQIL